MIFAESCSSFSQPSKPPYLHTIVKKLSDHHPQRLHNPIMVSSICYVWMHIVALFLCFGNRGDAEKVSEALKESLRATLDQSSTAFPYSYQSSKYPTPYPHSYTSRYLTSFPATFYSQTYAYTDVSCFPSHAEVMIQIQGSGEIMNRPMSELMIGDWIRTGEDSFEPIVYFSRHWIGWTREDAHVPAEFMELKTITGEVLSISPGHFLYTCASDRIAAKHVVVGDYVADADQGCVKIVEITPATRHIGAYSPMTPSGKMVVNNVIVSCFTESSWVNEELALAWFRFLGWGENWLPTSMLRGISDMVDVVGGVLFENGWFVIDKNEKSEQSLESLGNHVEKRRNQITMSTIVSLV